MRRGIDELRVAHSVVADVKTVAALVWLYAALTAGLLAFLLLRWIYPSPVFAVFS